MALNWGVTDVLTITKLAWDLYHNCYLVARGAPSDFRQLVNEFSSLQNVLGTLEDGINSDKSFLERLSEDRKHTLKHCILNCHDTLRQLKKLVLTYRELHVDEGLLLRKKWQWVQKQGEVAELKSKIMFNTSQLNLFMNSIGNLSLNRIEKSLETVMKRQEESQQPSQELECEGDDMVPINPSRSVIINQTDGLSVEGGMQGLRRAITGTTLADPGPNVSSDSIPSVSEVDATETPLTRARPALKACSSADKPRLSESHQIRIMEQSLRQLRIEHKDHQPDDILKEQFQNLVDDELRLRGLDARDWLRVATWWLLKAKHNMRDLERAQDSNPRDSFSVSVKGKSPTNQAYVDLLKASWILYTIILKEDNIFSLQMDENRKLLYSLSNGISPEFSLYKATDTPAKETLVEQNCNIWELLQSEEKNYDDDELLPGLDSGRWITVEQADAGENDEKVLFRTFVNAAIGGKKYRMKSKDAPYMLLLSTKEGESEPKITICNQSGTLGISRDFTIDDLQECETPTSPYTRSQWSSSNEAIPLNFGRLNVVIAFTNDKDLQQFIRIPRDYFEAVKMREPRQLPKATETLIFKRSVERLEQLEPSTMKPLSPRQQFRFCDLRVLETTTKEGWRTTRRLVISSSAAEKKPWCKEIFLPLSRVQVNRKNTPKQALVKWSDCTHEKTTTDGNYNPVSSFVYDDIDPNIALSLLFRNSADATDFETKILQLSIPPIFSRSTSSNSHFVYDISDTDPNPKNYKALLSTRTTKTQWKYSELFYIYRDTDYQYDRGAKRVRLMQVYYIDYISTHVDKLCRPSADKPPRFSHCEKRVGNTLVELDDEAVGMEFMSSLSGEHKLIFSRRAHHITTKPRSRLRGSKSNKGTAEVQLWQKGNSIRLLSRWDDKVEEKWLSMAVPHGGLDNRQDSNRASLPTTEYDRGRKIDLANLVARDSKEKTEGRKAGPINIAFESVRDREEFAAAMNGNAAPPTLTRSALDDFMRL